MGPWYDALRGIESRGSQAERPGSLAGLAAARSVHLGQFFTPDAVARVMWQIVEPAMEERFSSGYPGSFSIFDNSVGSGRLLQYADPKKHRLCGVDVDAALLVEMGSVIEAAGFNCEFSPCGMESIQPRGFDIALINPPFSVPIQSPLLAPYPCTTYGKFGPNTSTVSQAYALAQAVDAAEVVVALLPRSFVDELLAHHGDWLEEGKTKLAGVYDLPARSFREEGTDVGVSLMVFSLNGSGFGNAPRHKLETLEGQLPTINPVKLYGEHGWKAKLSVRGVEDEGPSITLPVTGDPTVRITHDGRFLRLHYACGLIEAKVANAILRNEAAEESHPDHRRPTGFRYSGQGVLDLEVHLAQRNPLLSFEGLLRDIIVAGGKPEVAPGLREHLRRRARKSRRQATPLRHTVYVPEGVASSEAQLTATPKKQMVADPKVWGSPVLQPGQAIEFSKTNDGQYAFSLAGKQYKVAAETLYEHFTVEQGAASAGWTVAHEGLQAAFPELGYALAARARALGIDKWLTWGYQFDDLVELAMKPHGAIAAWQMGLGKARLASALVLMVGCKHGLIVTEAGLVDEMLIELNGLPIPRDAWQIITTPSQARNLRSSSQFKI